MSEPSNIVVLPQVSERQLIEAVRRLALERYPRRLQAISDELSRRKQERRAA